MSKITLRDLENLTEKLYGPNQDPSLIEYANMLKESYINEANFQELFEYFINSSSQHCQFWVFDLLISIVNAKYESISSQMKLKFREMLIFLIENYIQKIFRVTFIETKFSVLFINWMKHDYPENWSNLFKDLISLIFNTENENLKMIKLNLFVNLLLTFDEELIKFRHTYTNYEVVRSTLIKDYMRKEAVGDIVYVLNQVLLNEKHFSKKIVKNSIKVISQLVDWNNLNLFSDIIGLISSSLIGNSDFQCECLELYNAFISKGMEINQKIEIIKYLNINQILEGFLKNYKNLNENSLFQICEIVGNIGNFTIECFDTFKSITKGEETLTNLNNLNQSEKQEFFRYICELTNYCLYHSITIINYAFKTEVKVALQLCDYLSNFISYLKSNEFLAENLIELLKSLIKTIEIFLIIPNEYDIKSSLLINKDEDDFFNFRKEFTILYHNFYQVTPLKLFILNSITERLEKLSQGFTIKYTVNEIELALHLIHFIQTGINNNELQIPTISDYFNKILYYLFSIPFSDVDSDFILIFYYETIYKYIQYIINNDNILLHVARLYLSKRGIMHENPVVGAKICQNFDKFVDKVKTQLAKMDIIYEISETLKNFIRYLTTENKNFVLLCEYSILFKTLGQCILQKNFNEEKRQIFFKEILSIFDSIFINFGLDNNIFNEVSKCITNFMKCIGFELNPNSKIIFIEYFDNFIKQIYLKLPKNLKVDYSMITILQRLIPILGKESLQYLEYFIENQVKYPDIETYEDSCKLLQNSTQILKKDSKIFIQNSLYYFYLSLKNIKLPETNISEMDKNIISLYCSFAKLIANITNDIVEVIFENGGLKNVDLLEFINFLNYVSIEIIDPNIRRTIVKSLKSIVIYFIKILSQGIDDSNTQILLNFLQIILNGSFKIYGKLIISDPIDFNTLPEIVQIHYYVLKEVSNFYIEYISNFLSQDNVVIFIEHLNIYDVKKFKVSDILLNYFNVIYY